MRITFRMLAVYAVAVSLAFAAYILISSTLNQHKFEKLEQERIQIIKDLAMATLQDESFITDEERGHVEEWNRLFDKYGIEVKPEQGASYWEIPIDTPDVMTLLPSKAKPVYLQRVDHVIDFRYHIENRSYELIYDLNQPRIFKTVSPILDNPGYIISCFNDNNQTYTPNVTHNPSSSY